MRGMLFFKRILRDNRGATAIEYGLIMALVCLAIIASMDSMASRIIETWGKVDTTVTDATNNARN